MTSDNIVVRKGETFTITLKSNPQSGYLWYFDAYLDEAGNLNKNPTVQIMDEIKEPLRNYSGSLQHFKFMATNIGITNLSFIYKRSWETTPYTVKEFEILSSEE